MWTHAVCCIHALALPQVFVWEDADEDVVATYKTYEGHQEDIQCMAAYPRRQLLATGARRTACLSAEQGCSVQRWC
jgi:hypothetical protein